LKEIQNTGNEITMDDKETLTEYLRRIGAFRNQEPAWNEGRLADWLANERTEDEYE